MVGGKVVFADINENTKLMDIEDCIKKISNPFELVLFAAQRAKELNQGEISDLDKENDKREREGKGDRIQYRFASGYAGQFQTHYKGINKKRPVMGMHGRGGQHIVIDFERASSV